MHASRAAGLSSIVRSGRPAAEVGGRQPDECLIHQYLGASGKRQRRSAARLPAERSLHLVIGREADPPAILSRSLRERLVFDPV